MKSGNELTEYGRAIMEKLEPGLADAVSARLGELDPDLPRLITDYALARWSDGRALI